MKHLLLSLLLSGSAAAHTHSDHPTKPVAGAPKVIPFSKVKSFTNNGNTLKGLATKSHGAKEHEVWHSSVAPKSRTPLHIHNSEETFVILKGSGVLKVGDKTIPFKAPSTVIAPAGVQHQLINTGDVPTEQIVIIGIDSEIKAGGKVLKLPWRN